MSRLDVTVAVLGGGSAGENLATTLAKAGTRVVLVEKRLVGGECPYFACIPSKAMLISAEARHALADAASLGASAQAVDAGDPDGAWATAVERRDGIAADHDDSGHTKDLLAAGVLLLRGEGTVTGPGRMTVVTAEGEDTVSFDHLVVATGSAPVIPDLPGLRAAEPWTFEEAWTTTDRPDRLAIMGGGAVGCEIAQTFARFGTEVTLVERSRLGAGVEPETADDLAALLRRDGVDVREDAELDAAHRNDDGTVTVTVDGTDLVVDELVVAAGMAPRLEGLGLETLGIDVDSFAIDGHGRVVGATDVWAVGDVAGIAPFTHTANYQAGIVAANLRGGDRVADYRAIPRAIYTSPSVAATGLTRDQAQEQGIDVVSTVFDLGDTSRAHVDVATAGRVVLVADRDSRRLVGASMVGPAAGESISELSLAVRAGIPVDVLADVVHPFPTWSEGLDPAFQQLLEALEG